MLGGDKVIFACAVFTYMQYYLEQNIGKNVFKNLT